MAWAVILCSSCGTASAQQIADGVIVNIRKGELKAVKLQVITNDVIRVTASPEVPFAEEVNFIQDMTPRLLPPFNVDRHGDTIVLRTATTSAYLLQETGELWFTDRIGNLILREKKGGGKEFTPIEVEGTKGYSLRQVFENREGEALYGLGQHQSDEFNYKGRNEELFQYNTKVSIPFVVSTKGYGLLWHNYSLSRFGDKRPYANLSEAFTLYGSGQEEGGLTAVYYADRTASTILYKRQEPKIDYEDLSTVRHFPRNFPRWDAYAVWEGELEPKETGVYHFKLHYAGYTKVFIDGKEVIPERWRTAWNPNDYKAKLSMEKGKRYPIRIEWQPDGNMSYLGLKVLAPLPEEEQQQLAFWSEMGDAIDYYFINGGQSIDGVISGYRSLTGKSPVMPKWAMGYWLSRERYKTQDELLEALGEYRKRQVPLDVIIQDWSYWPVNAWGSHEFDLTRFPDAAGMIRQVHEQKARFMISVWPKFYITTEHYKELDRLGAMYQQAVKDSIRDWIYPGYIGSFYDAYNTKARKLFWEQMNEHLYGLGVDAWWMDASEPNIQDNTNMDYRKLLCGPTALGPSTKFFNAYALLNAEAIYNGQRGVNPLDRVFLLTRSGFAGQQRYSTATWSGDIGTRWEDMKAQISAGLNFSLSGIPYWTMDIGGFSVEKRYEKATEGSEDMDEWRELNTRWYQFGAFCPLFRSHGQYPYREIYNISPEGTPTYRSMKYYTDLRYRLMPYIYSLAGMTCFEDYTIMRALVMDYVEDTATHSVGDQFMFGPALMVAPIYQYKARSREVYFPDGIWYDFYSGKSFAGGGNRTVEAPYEQIPLFVRAGSIIPMGEPVQSTAEVQADLSLSIYTGKDASFTLYEDNGLTYDYEKGLYSTITLVYTEADKRLTIGARKGSYPEMIKNRNINIILPAGKTINIMYTGEEVTIPL
jgi:alpha-D-xyloside xylohydrolase